MMPSTRRWIKERIFSGSLVVQGMILKPAWWSSATLTAGLEPRRGASTGERGGGGAVGGGGGGGGSVVGFGVGVGRGEECEVGVLSLHGGYGGEGRGQSDC